MLNNGVHSTLGGAPSIGILSSNCLSRQTSLGLRMPLSSSSSFRELPSNIMTSRPSRTPLIPEQLGKTSRSKASARDLSSTVWRALIMSARDSCCQLCHPEAGSLDFGIGQTVAAVCETNSNLRMRVAKQFDKALSLRCRNNRILISRADPHAHRGQIRQLFGHKRYHRSK